MAWEKLYNFRIKAHASFHDLIHIAISRRLVFALLLLPGSLGWGQTVTLLPQEQAIATDMITNPSQGRPYMVLDPTIEEVARAAAKSMAVQNYFAEVNPEGQGANYLLREAGYVLPSWWSTAASLNYVESIAAGSSSSSVIWTAWMNSPPHKEHLLAQNSFYATETHYGVGYYYDPNSTYQYYWVVITAPPQPLSITTPAPGAQVFTPSIPVAGTADSATGVAAVRFRVENGSGDGPYQTATKIANWSGTATGLVGGSNVIRAQSLDSSGNLIAQVTRTVDYFVQATLTVSVSGSGSVTGGFLGATTRTVGNILTLNATAAPGSIFTGWTGSVVSSNASINFPMQSGLTLEANFEANPFIPVAGTYAGILTTGPGTPEGLARVAITTGGMFSGRVYLGGNSWGVAGSLDLSGSATVTMAGSGTPPWTVTLQADLGGDSGEIAGTVSNGAASYDFTGSQSSYNTTTNLAPEAGFYTVVLPPSPGGTGSAVPQGDGFATIFIGPGGAATVTGRLANGTTYSTTNWVADDGSLALYCVPWGAPAGSTLTGVLDFTPTDGSDVEGTLTWNQTPAPGGARYPAGFATQLAAVGSRYTPPAAGLDALGMAPGAATVALGDGNLAETLDVPVMIGKGEDVTMVTPGTPDVALSIDALTGVVTGHFVPPGSTTARPVYGVVLQKQNSAFGYFWGTSQSGVFSLGPGE